MKSRLNSFVAALALISIPTFAHAGVLKVDCVFVDPEIKDHVLVELTTDQRGTFYYSAESDGSTDATPTDKLELKRVESNQPDQAKWLVNRDEVKLYFVMPSNLVSRASDSFKGNMLTEIPGLNLSNEQEMKCSSKY